MINLYSINNTEYSKNGDATLQPLRCELTMAINGGWQLELELPYDKDEKWKLVEEGTVVRVTLGCVREQATVQQRFRVYDYRKTLKSLVAIAFPVAMESTQDAPIDNLAITNKTGVEAMALLQAKTNKYTLYTDITKRGTTSISNSNLNYAIASGESGCFIDVWGGECVYDNLTYKVLSQIGDKNNASKYPVIYGRNMTGIDYERDDSGMVTRIYPISSDGIRLNGSGYVDSPIIHNYPIVHARFMSAPYQLVIDKETDNSATATATRTALAAIKTASMTPSHNITISLISGAVRVPFDYIKKHKSGDENQAGIIDSVQAMATAEIYHETLKSKANKAIKDGMMDENNGAFVVADKYLEKNWEWHEDTSVTPHAWWYGYEGDGDSVYARNEYIKIGKYYEYFNDDGYWEEYKRIPSIDLYHNDDGSWSIGYREGYYAHNEYVYATVNGTMQEWWYDSDGWYVADSSGESDFGWHGDSSSGVWFGEEDAGSEDKSKYLHDCWAFIDGTYYFFDQYGYTDADPVHSLPDYPWDRQVDEKTGKEWFGNTNKSIGAKWLYNQWIKLDGDYYYVDSEGYVRDENDSVDAVVNAYVTGLASLKTVCNTQRDTLYALLYQQMTAWCNKQYEAGIDKPVVTIRVDMADLSKTDEYKNYAQLEKICLGDVVECIDSEHGINTQERVIGLTYDCIRGYNKNIVIGHTEASLGSILSTNTGGSSVPSGFDTSAIETALTTQGNAIATLQNGKQDKLTAGENITIVNNVISATGGGGHGLEYWTETSESIYRAINEETYDFSCDDAYLSQGINFTMTAFMGGERTYTSTGKAVAAYGQFWQQYGRTQELFTGIVIISTDEDSAKYKCYDIEFAPTTTTIDGHTVYVNTNNYFMYNTTILDDGGLINTGEHESWDAFVEYVKANAGIIIYTRILKDAGIGVGDKVVWGGNRYSASDEYPFYATDNGLVYGKKHISKGTHEGMSADAHVYNTGFWTNFVGGLANGFEYRKLNNEDALMGWFGEALNKAICLVSSESANAVKWQFRSRGSSDAWQDMSAYSTYSDKMWTTSFEYNNTTWYMSVIGVFNGSSTGGTVDGLDFIDQTIIYGTEASAIDLSKHFIDVTHAIELMDVVVEVSTESYCFRYGGATKNFVTIDIDGNAVFKEITTDAGSLTQQMAQKQNLLTAGSNIQINGDTISATDTTYEEFDGGSAGLVPAVTTQSGKFLKDDGTWDDAGTEVEANPSGSATATLNKVAIDNVIYSLPSGGGGGGGSFVGLTKSQYDALPTADKEDTSKLYLVQEGGGGTLITPVDMSGGTPRREGSMNFNTTSTSVQSVWNGGSSIGGQYTLKAIDLTDIDELSWELVSTTCYAHNNSNVEEQTNANWHICVGLSQSLPTSWANASTFSLYAEYKYTNTTYSSSECKLDVSSLTGVYYITLVSHGWNLLFSNLKTKQADKAEITRHTYWNNAKWSQWASNRITYGTTTPTGDANDGDLYILLDSNNSKQGEYLYMNNAWVQIE